ncbi:hypothetical protein PUNSTDRAFT_145733 [Punctularia strigosozonata HHB-11173 SS5]|uniref:uncharacterized protein n=1 Tax=Punctularia strigosozonata (strain HHB-11173) TaxID=741275 RepID=UPI00044167A5|nr:uncharacterized protein PUNSTDRAFT_145733 [Punctularia strigosozonata HHB-11173 SS5]EIN05824.1 hypothetical protein PUNSTDRAFT_145733 [Punctularia strigosozonata HHB-11173 SS5]
MQHLEVIPNNPRTNDPPFGLLDRIRATGVHFPDRLWPPMAFHLRELIQKYLVPGKLIGKQLPAALDALIQEACAKYPILVRFESHWPIREYVKNYLYHNQSRDEWPMLSRRTQRSRSSEAPSQLRGQNEEENVIDLSRDSDEEEGVTVARYVRSRVIAHPSSRMRGDATASRARRISNLENVPTAPPQSRIQGNLTQRRRGPELDPLDALLANGPPKTLQRLRPALRVLGIREQADVDSICGSDAHARDDWLDRKLQGMVTTNDAGSITPLDLFLLKQAFVERKKNMGAGDVENAA